jgi:type 1 glutamine amidotransferase
MNRLVTLLLCCVGCAFGAVSALAEDPAPAKPITILLTYGGHGFEEKAFFEMFDKFPGIQYTKAPLPKSADLLKPGLEKEYDAIVLYDMVKSISADQRKAFVELLQTGIGVVALHHNLGAHADWPEYRKIIGGKYFFKPETFDGQAHPASSYAHGQDMKITVTDKDHPITTGLQDFEIHDEAYKNYYTAPDVKVLLKTDHPKNDPSIAWVTRYGRSRVFYFMLGHDSKAWKQPAYPEILSRGIRWAASKEK